MAGDWGSCLAMAWKIGDEGRVEAIRRIVREVAADWNGLQVQREGCAVDKERVVKKREDGEIVELGRWSGRAKRWMGRILRAFWVPRPPENPCAEDLGRRFTD